MRKLIITSVATVVVWLPVTANAATIIQQYNQAYHAVATKFGKRAPGRNIVRYGLSGGRNATSVDLRRSLGTLNRMLHPQPVAVAATPSRPVSAPVSSAPAAVTSTGGYSNVPGVPASFAACVAFRESTNGAGSPNIYGIIPASGYSVAGMSVAQQKAVFAQLYAKDGTTPWAPYDGC